MQNVCLKAFQPEARLEILVAETTDACREAQTLHQLAPTSAVAFGRLLTGASLLAIQNKQPGSLSLQILSQARIKSMFADCTHEGHLRGYAKETTLAFPLSASERTSGRRTVGAAVAPGKLSIVRLDAEGRYGQSATPLVDGEIDTDLEHFIDRSDQVDNALRIEVRLDDLGRITRAAGVLIQALPDGDRSHLAELRQKLHEGLLADQLIRGMEAQELLTAIDAQATPVDQPLPLRWRCRCSHERVLRSLVLFEVQGLMELIEADEPVEVRCDLCTKTFSVSVDEIRTILEKVIKAQA
ncbi:MAG: Hsp33 family molecular chaperone HslO [Myxococcota bacterium]